jgi:hypothetical protein
MQIAEVFAVKSSENIVALFLLFRDIAKRACV